MPLLETKRLFIACVIPEKIRKFLHDIQGELKKSGSDAKWVEKENIHLTLKFFGNVNLEKIKNLTHALSEAFSRRPVFDVSLNKIGCFPSLSQPRVVWAGLKDNKSQLKEIAQLLEESFLKIGFEKESREFQAHITLGRLRSFLNKLSLIERIDSLNKNLIEQNFSLNNITLFESQLTPHGPLYSTLHQVKFL